MRIKCECGRANYEERVLSEYDVGLAIGLDGHLLVEDFPALVCPSCGSVMTEGLALEPIVGAVLADMLRHERLSPKEAKYLRLNTLDSQEKFARHLGVTRATVNRWETGAVVLDGTSSLAVRSHVFFRVYENEPRMRDLLNDLHQYFAGVERAERRTAPRVIGGRLVAA
jgi:DNA-binding XRE family transcriptional regulator